VIQKSQRVWLGGLFAPEAFVTATRQCVAQANAWSLEELVLEVRVAASFDKLPPLDECSFGVTGTTFPPFCDVSILEMPKNQACG